MSLVTRVLGDLAKETLRVFSHLVDHGSHNSDIFVELGTVNVDVHAHENALW